MIDAPSFSTADRLSTNWCAHQHAIHGLSVCRLRRGCQRRPDAVVPRSCPSVAPNDRTPLLSTFPSHTHTGAVHIWFYADDVTTAEQSIYSRDEQNVNQPGHYTLRLFYSTVRIYLFGWASRTRQGAHYHYSWQLNWRFQRTPSDAITLQCSGIAKQQWHQVSIT